MKYSLSIKPPITTILSPVLERIRVDKIQAKTFIRDYRFTACVMIMALTWVLVANLIFNNVFENSLSMSDEVKGFSDRFFSRLKLFLALLVIWRVSQFTWKNRHQPMFDVLRSNYKANPLAPFHWVIMSSFAALSFILMMTSFMTLKTAIPRIIPFYLDTLAANIDHFLFLGRDPWTVFVWIYDLPWLVRLIDITYTAWAALLASIWFYCFTSNRMEATRRYQFIIAMMLLWALGGNVLATLLSSVGPVYFEYFTGSARFVPLMEHLNLVTQHIPLNAVGYHGILLDLYENPGQRVGGISAMPSLHCASSVLMLLVFWKNKILRTLMIMFNVVIFSGSVILAWHYFSDGVIAIPLALFCWWLAAKIVTRFVTLNVDEAHD